MRIGDVFKCFMGTFLVDMESKFIISRGSNLTLDIKILTSGNILL